MIYILIHVHVSQYRSQKRIKSQDFLSHEFNEDLRKINTSESHLMMIFDVIERKEIDG